VFFYWMVYASFNYIENLVSNPLYNPFDLSLVLNLKIITKLT